MNSTAYLVPSAADIDIFDAPRREAFVLDPTGQRLIVASCDTTPPAGWLHRPLAHVCGIPIDRLRESRRWQVLVRSFQVLDITAGHRAPIALPEHEGLGPPVWSPDGRLAAAVALTRDASSIVLLDADHGTAQLMDGIVPNDVLSTTFDGGYLAGALRRLPAPPLAWSRDSRTLFVLTTPIPGEPRLKLEPVILDEHNNAAWVTCTGNTSSADYDLLNRLATSQLVAVDVESGRHRHIGWPGALALGNASPDGQFLAMQRLCTSDAIAHRTVHVHLEVWGLDGQHHDLGHGSAQAQRRAWWWQETAPARLLTQDSDLLAFDAASGRTTPLLQDREVIDVKWFCDDDLCLVTEREAEGTRRLVLNVRTGETAPAVVSEPEVVLEETNTDGTVTIVGSPRRFFTMCGHSGPAGLSTRVEVRSNEGCEEKPIWSSVPGAFEIALSGWQETASTFLVWRESPSDPGSLLVIDRSTGARSVVDQQDHPHPHLAPLHPQPVAYGHGEQHLTGLLYLPAHATESPPPLLVWAPQELAPTPATGHLSGTPSAMFQRLGEHLALWPLLWGYAVLVHPTVPQRLGDNEKDESFGQHLAACIEAGVDHLAVSGVVDAGRVAVGGHSYGAFLAALATAFTDRFSAAICLSGCYDRRLSPFGFQGEQRRFWEAPDAYDDASIIVYADRMATPMLLIHGAGDENPLTPAVHSEALFRTLRNLGTPARFILLPGEGHQVTARESLLHVIEELRRWLAEWCPSSAATASDL